MTALPLRGWPAWALLLTCVCGLVAATALWQATVAELAPVPESFAEITTGVTRLQVVDRHGRALNATYANDWNLHERAALHEVPELLVQAFIAAEDQRFFAHHGPDWLARLRALAQNVLALEVQSGASTITEQVVRMIHPRPRTVWSRWLEGFEAGRLEQEHGKLAVLEFYLNQVPYAANRRGVVQAAHYYFDRDLDTLAPAEVLALAVLVRAPSRLDLRRGDRQALAGAMERLAVRLVEAGVLEPSVQESIAGHAFALSAPELAVDARHFLSHALREAHGAGHEGTPGRLRTTLDAALQARLQGLLDERLRALAASEVHNAALLVADHRSNEVLAWVVGGSADEGVQGRLINAVVTPRQPGSALKPFLYALALEQGWTAATLIDDAPLTEMVGNGLHSYTNYSRTFYGPLALRDALGNSLNIPALRAIQFTGAAAYLELLEDLGFESLGRRADFYGDGLALGNGEVTLLELVTAYAALARNGIYQPLSLRADEPALSRPRRVVTAEVSSLVGNILSDPEARQLEFGRGSLLNLPVQTAVKTGTSSDYRDSWAVGYDDRHVVGVWMGNLDQTPTLGITGSTGPALVLRATFDLLNRNRDTRPLWLSPRLVRTEICSESGLVPVAAVRCRRRMEFFLPGTEPASNPLIGRVDPSDKTHDGVPIRLRQPTPGLNLALDPRLPLEVQAFEFVLEGVAGTDRVEWRVDAAAPVVRRGAAYLWSLARGEHTVRALVRRGEKVIGRVEPVRFLVK